MGEAKRRGIFGKRKEIAIRCNTETLKKQKLAEITKRQAMTPEEKEREKQIGTFLTISAGMEVITSPFTSIIKWQGYTNKFSQIFKKGKSKND